MYRITQQPDAAPGHEWLWETPLPPMRGSLPGWACGTASTREEAVDEAQRQERAMRLAQFRGWLTTTITDQEHIESGDDRNALRRDLTSCRAELAAIGIMLQERSALPDPGGPNFALVAGAVLKYILTLEGRIR